ncbi:uncharacterized protein A4U43_C02F20700 [Asparagus officinalis]|uniref:Serine aminopeptidase S33 domain-containing protein n=1 Tax=Asparagus officinalis TaxID=4686 RepID=A0A5P1FK20_ASPOF|nr:uncharacterized protein A4U43_C02F20700 [Asparagus officinalis]
MGGSGKAKGGGGGRPEGWGDREEGGQTEVEGEAGGGSGKSGVRDGVPREKGGSEEGGPPGRGCWGQAGEGGSAMRGRGWGRAPRGGGLVNFVENSVKNEHALSPNRPIYLIGDSFGGCLSLAVAARNPSVDLVLVLVNPATSFGNSQLQPFLPVLEALPDDIHTAVPYVLSFIMGDPVKMAMANVDDDLPPPRTLEEISKSLTSLLPLLSVR